MAVQRNIQFANNKQILTFLFVISCGRIRHGCGTVLCSCHFGTNTDETYCGMIQSQNDDFDWKLTSTSEKSNTGPQTDHTGNPNGAGRFLWADSSVGGGKRTTIFTPAFNLTNDHGFLTFYYYLYGTGEVGSLEVRVCEGGDPVWTISGNQGMEWKEQNITPSCDSNMTQVSFTAQITSKTSDIAIDDVVISVTSLTTAAQSASHTTGTAAITYTGKTSAVPASAYMTTIGSNSVATTNRLDATDVTAHSTVMVTITFTQAGNEITRYSPKPIRGSNVALTVSLVVVTILVLAALTTIVCFLRHRRQIPDEPVPKDHTFKYDNRAYDMSKDASVSGTPESRGHTASTFDSSTWHSTLSVPADSGVNGKQDGNKQSSQKSQISSSSVVASTASDTSETDYYFKLNPGRASMLIEDDDAVIANGPDAGTSKHLKQSQNSGANAKPFSQPYDAAADAIGILPNGYDAVVVKDDETGGYQFVDESNVPTSSLVGEIDAIGSESNGYEAIAVNATNPDRYQTLYKAGPDADDAGNGTNNIRSPYELLSFPPPTHNQEGKAPVPAVRQNVPPKPRDRMVDNVLYKPMNDELREVESGV